MWEDAIKDLEKRRKLAFLGGGEARNKKQHKLGKMTARERICYLLDDGSFKEVDDFVESRIDDFGMDKKRVPGDGVITGYGTIDERLVFVAAEDFTVVGGTLGEYHSLKICRIQDMAIEMEAPLILLNDSGGARIEEGIHSLSGYSGMFLRNTKASGVIPQIAVILGPCSGGACYSPAICDFIFMVKDTGKMFITGPKVVKSVTGEEVTIDELGGSHIHESISGVTHFVYEDEKTCLNGVKKLLSYLPSNCCEEPPMKPGEAVDRTDLLYQIVPDNPRKPYDVHKVIETMVDKGSFMEIQERYAANIVIGFGRLDGSCIGFVANQPNWIGGALDCNASSKMARFIRFCDCFNIPLITLVDVPAFCPGKEQEHGGIIKHGAKILYAYAEAEIPKITLIMRKAYGGAYIAMNSKNLGADLVFAWPIAEIAVMGADGAVDIISHKEIAAASNPTEERKRLKSEYEKRFNNPYIAAAGGYVDKVIKPEETRQYLKSALDMLKTKKRSVSGKKHGNIPL